MKPTRWTRFRCWLAWGHDLQYAGYRLARCTNCGHEVYYYPVMM